MKNKINFFIFINLVLIIFTGYFPFTSGAQELTSNKFTPSEGKVIFIVGQDNNTIDTYVKNIGITPAGFMFYTSIQKMEGISEPINLGAGPSHAQYLIDKYPNSVIQIGLYMVNALDGVIQGTYDNNIDKLSEWLKKIKRPVYLRIGYEFDFNQNNYNPEKYIKAYQYIVNYLRNKHIKNVAYVWHSKALSTVNPVMNWYPGDEYVDWFGISYFNLRTKQMDYFSDLAKKHNKPLMIAESTPQGVGTHYANHAWERWFNPFFKFIEEKNVKLVSYINSNWEEMPMWKGQGWGDARVEANEKIKNWWIEEIKNEKYLQSSEKLYKILNYTP